MCGGGADRGLTDNECTRGHGQGRLNDDPVSTATKLWCRELAGVKRQVHLRSACLTRTRRCTRHCPACPVRLKGQDGTGVTGHKHTSVTSCAGPHSQVINRYPSPSPPPPRIQPNTFSRQAHQVTVKLRTC